MEHYRQGDILLRAIEALPAARLLPAQAKRDEAGREGALTVTVGIGSRHLHQVELGSGSSAFRIQGRDAAEYLHIQAPGARLIHPEHAAIDLPPGLYQVVRQRDHDPLTDQARAVVD